MSTYEGDDTFPESVPLIDDMTVPMGEDLNPTLEGALDRTRWLKNRVVAMSLVEVLATGNITVPDGALLGLAIGCGGGAGGGAGTSYAPADQNTAGGAGGGGAVERTAMFEVVGGETLEVTIGAGGAGGTPGLSAVANPGAPGGLTQIKRLSDSTILAKFQGARGGRGGQWAADGGPQQTTWSLGGAPVTNAGGSFLPDVITIDGATSDLYKALYLHHYAVPQHGGHGVTRTIDPQRGMHSPQGFLGGTGANHGVDGPSTYYGGGAGGGGGAGPYGNGGVGGDGGNGDNLGDGTNGTNGGSAADNSGAGGGGAGSAGATIHGTSEGATGGAGGSGRIRILFFGRANLGA